jgi:hypothetical protein
MVPRTTWSTRWGQELRTLEFLTSFAAMFRQAENEQLIPDSRRLAQSDADVERFIKSRFDLIALWQGIVHEYQPALREYYALMSASASNPQ